jgi:WD40 repeat protein
MASPGTVHSLAFSDDDAALVAGCADCAVRVYDTGVAHSISENSSASSGSTHVADTSVIIRARHTFFSKQTPVLHVSFAARGLVVAGGAYRPTFA